MTIASISLFRQWQPFRDGTYRCSGGRSAEGFDSTIVEIVARDGTAGYGEMAPLGSFYDPAFAEGARAAMRELAPKLIGEPAAGIDALNRRMDLLLKGHPYAKSAIDMALWDLAGKRSGLSLATMTGGAEGASHCRSTGRSRRKRRTPWPRGRENTSPKATAACRSRSGSTCARTSSGWRRCAQPSRPTPSSSATPTPVGARPRRRQFLLATRSLDYALEQPCATYEENLAIRRACDRPLVLDETIDSVDTLLRALADSLVDGITIKLARVGGLTKARLIRDIAVARNLKITIEDTGGAEIDTAAYSGLMLSTPEGLRQHTVDFHNWVTVSNARADFRIADGQMTLPDGPGLGVEVDKVALGEPIFTCSA